MQNLEKRVSQMEQLAPKVDMVLIARFVKPGGEDEAWEIEQYSQKPTPRQSWSRLDTESEKDFIKRAKAEGKKTNGVMLLLASGRD